MIMAKPQPNTPHLKLVRPEDHDLRVLSPCEAAALLGCSVWTLYRRIKAGDVPAVRAFGNGQWKLGRVGNRWATASELMCIFGHL